MNTISVQRLARSLDTNKQTHRHPVTFIKGFMCHASLIYKGKSVKQKENLNLIKPV